MVRIKAHCKYNLPPETKPFKAEGEESSFKMLYFSMTTKALRGVYPECSDDLRAAQGYRVGLFWINFKRTTFMKPFPEFFRITIDFGL